MITGASGIVGKELAHQLKKNEKYKIFLLSNSKIKIKNKKDKFTVLKQDLTKPLVFNLKMDTIVHCASKNPLSNFILNYNYITMSKTTAHLQYIRHDFYYQPTNIIYEL